MYYNKTMKQDKKPLFKSDHYGKWVVLSEDKKNILDYSDKLISLSKKFGTKGVIYTKPVDPSKNYAF